MTETKSVSITSLIAIPVAITLCVTILRLIGELQGWSPLFFNKAAGGGGAIMGISWLPIIFGPYFALKLIRAGDGPSSSGKSIGFAFLGLVVYILAMLWAESTFRHPSFLSLILLLVALGTAFIPRIAWRSFGNTLIAYAFAARIPVLIVMLIAMAGNGGKGWGTHYDVVMPQLAQASLAKKFVYEAFLPQMTMWIGWTVALGSVFGTIVGAVAGRRKQAAQAPV